MPDSAEKLASIQANVAALTANIGDIKEGMSLIRTSVESGNKQNAEIIARLAVIEHTQKQGTEYQAKCEADRNSLETRVLTLENQKLDARVARNDRRLTDLEGDRSWLRGAWRAVAGISAVTGGAVGAVAVALLPNVFGKH